MIGSPSARTALILLAGFLTAVEVDAADTLSLKAAQIPSGGATLATLTLGQVATADTNFLVGLSGTNAAQAVDRIQITKGQSRTEFLVTSAPAPTEQFADITITEPGSTRVVARTRLTVTPPLLTSLVLNKSEVVGGTQGSMVTGTVTLEGVPGGQGLNVPLGQSCSACQADQYQLELPTSVRVPGGARTASFSFEPGAVGASKQFAVLASLGSAVKSAGLAIVPVLLQGLSVSPSTIAGGQSATLTVTLNAPALNIYSMKLSCTSTLLVTVASVEKPCANDPKTVAFTTAPGQSSVTFPIRSAPLSSPTQVTLRVSSTSLNGDVQTTLMVAP